MFTRIVQRKRPRGSALLVITGALVAAGLLATAVLAAWLTDSGTVNVQVPNNTTSVMDAHTNQNALISYIGDNDPVNGGQGSSGTGGFDPFVRLQASPNEAGYNTDGATEFDTKTGNWTHSILVSEIPQRPCGSFTCFELFVDINEKNNDKLVQLNIVDVWFTEDPNLSGYPFTATATTTNEYKFVGTILINDVNQGSGRGDLRYNIPIDDPAHPITLPTDCNYGNPDCETYFVLYSQWGTLTSGGFSSTGGFEEWKVRVYPVPPDISVAKSPDDGSINGGQDAVFTIVVSNNGVVPADNVTLTDVLPNSGLSWTLGGANAASCSISGTPATLNCSFGTVAVGATRTITLTSPTTVDDCGTINNTVTVSATGDVSPSNNTDTGDITVACGALQITKTAKHAEPDPEISTADLAGRFTVVDANGDSHTLTTDATGVGCIGGIAVGETTSITEVAADFPGYDVETIANVIVASGTCADAGVTNVDVANTPLTDISWSVDSLHDGGTSTIVTCYDDAGAVIDGYPVVIDGDGDDEGTLPNLFPTDPDVITVSCDFAVDP